MTFVNRLRFVYLYFFMLLSACLSDPKRVLITGVNETLTPKVVENQETDLPRHKKPDPTPYSDLEIVGPLPKDAIVRGVHQHRKALDHCYRDIFHVADAVSQRESRQAYYDRANRHNMDNKRMQADGLLHSPTFSQPIHGSDITTDGDVTLHFLVLEDGTVQEARTSLSDFRVHRFHSCLEKALMGFQFPAQRTSTKVRHLLLRFSHEYGLIRQE